MLASLLVRPGQLELREVETPCPGPGEVVIKIRAALTCGTDLKAFLRGHPKNPGPTLLGHEFSGEIAQVGKGVKAFREGDQVMSVHSAPCGTCYYCCRGQDNLCERLEQAPGVGAFAEFIRVPSHIVQQNMYAKPSHLSFKEAALLEPLACVLHGFDQVALRHDDTVAVIGAGAIGLIHLLVLRTLGLEKVMMIGRRAYRLRLARELGAAQVVDAEREEATTVVRESTHGIGADVVIECTGKPEVWESAIRMVRRGGQVVLFGGCPSGTTVSVDTGRLHYDQIRLCSPFHYTRAAVRRSYDVLTEGLSTTFFSHELTPINPKEKGFGKKPESSLLRADSCSFVAKTLARLITAEYPLQQLPKVFSLLRRGDCVKYAVIP
jgi:L-iditol 2-dehydrogenase